MTWMPKSLERDRWIYRYVTAMGNSDMEIIKEVLEAAKLDPELDRIIQEIDKEFAREEGLDVKDSTKTG